MRILAIDDDHALLDFYRQFLGDEGHEVLVAHEGAEGLAKVQAHRPDVILLDILMPGMGGNAFLAALALTAERDTPVIVVARQARRIPLRAYLPKPFEIADLLALITQVRAGPAVGERA